jgi:hypothetical protein
MLGRYCRYRRLDPCILNTLYVPHIDQVNVRKLHTSVTCNEYIIAHNCKGYDSLLILEYLYQNGVKPTIIANGAKNMYIEVPGCRVRMIDSILKIESLCVVGLKPHEEGFSFFQFHGIRVVVVYGW